MHVISKQTASKMIVDYILSQIQDGNLKKGDRLMSENEFAEYLGVSRIPLREALCSLRTVGIIESRQGGGSYITSTCDPSTLGRMLYDYSLLENVALNDTLDVRLMLEPAAAGLAADNASASDKAELFRIASEYKSIMNSYSGSPDENSRVIALDRAFHKLISKAGGNTFLWMLYSVAEESISTLLNYDYLSTDKGARSRKKSAAEHLKIAKAIKQGDSEKAKALMIKHLEGASIRQK